MNFRRPSTLASMLVALAACTDVPLTPEAAVGPAAHPPDEVALLGKEIFVRCKPHVNPQFAEIDQRPPAVLAVSPPQTVDVDLGDYARADARFRAQLLVRQDGQACGQARLEYREDYAAGGSGILTYLIVFSSGTVADVDGAIRVTFEGDAEVCSEQDGECRVEQMTGSLDYEPTDDDPIWQFHVAHFSSAHAFPASTRLVFPGGDFVGGDPSNPRLGAE
jgi:hypothetical protein